ncbi:hypothetical protein AB0C27_31060 [Nonomuraea sp. NPDC048882]|uniref:hypothetical protein n=1 Tax=Nonomuraea sp. NPDC048882 TaxID=3154347 RepID=UPI0033C74A89
MRALFEVLCGPLAQPVTPGVRFGRCRTVSFDGCSSLKVPDTGRNRAWLDRLAHGGYPQLELMTLVETGTRAMIGAAFGSTALGETDYARRLLHLLRPDMLVLWDKGFDGNDFLAAVTGTGAQVLGRLRSAAGTVLAAPAGAASQSSAHAAGMAGGAHAFYCAAAVGEAGRGSPGRPCAVEGPPTCATYHAGHGYRRP